MKLTDIVIENQSYSGEERRAVERTPVQTALSAMAHHMYEIKRRLDDNDIDAAKKLVDGAIAIFSKGSNNEDR